MQFHHFHLLRPLPPPSILACRHGNMHMCCIHFSNKKRKKEVVVGTVWCEGGMCPLSSPTPTPRPVRQARSSSTPSTVQQPPVHQSPAYTCSFSKIPYKSRLQRQRWRNNGIETEYRRGANMVEICHLYHNRNDVGSRGGMKKCSRQPVIPGESGRFHLQGARLS